jgi:hypothetical protein
MTLNACTYLHIILNRRKEELSTQQQRQSLMTTNISKTSLHSHSNSLNINRRRLLLIIRSKVLSRVSVTMKRATLDSAVLKNAARDRSSGARATMVSECDAKGRDVSRVITNSRISIGLIAVLDQSVFACNMSCHSKLTCGSAAGTNSGCGAGADSTADARSDRAAGASADSVVILPSTVFSHSAWKDFVGDGEN